MIALINKLQRRKGMVDPRVCTLRAGGDTSDEGSIYLSSSCLNISRGVTPQRNTADPAAIFCEEREHRESLDLPRRTPTSIGSPKERITTKTGDGVIEVEANNNAEMKRKHAEQRRIYTDTRPRQLKKRIWKNTRANIKIESLNIQERGAMTIYDANYK